MKIIESNDFEAYWKNIPQGISDKSLVSAVEDIISAVRSDGDTAIRGFASRFDKSSPEKLEISSEVVRAAYEDMLKKEPALVSALKLSAEHIKRFADRQRSQFADFEYEIEPGIFTGQRVIPVQRAAVYVPGGRFPLISSVLMGIIPALSAGVEEVILASPPAEDGLPDKRILAAAYMSAPKGLRVFAMGGAQAVAALAIGTETVPRADVIAGPGNKYVAMAKRLLFGEIGIDLIAGPTDVLIIADESSDPSFIAADMLAQAEHDPDARSRVLVSNKELAERISVCLKERLTVLDTAETAQSSLLAGGLIVIYKNREDAVKIANTIAPEHLELHLKDSEAWLPALKNYGSVFIGKEAAEVLGDYSAGINHTLPTSSSARFTGGLSVRHFLKTLTTLRCQSGKAYNAALEAAECIARAEGLSAHAESAAIRLRD